MHSGKKDILSNLNNYKEDILKVSREVLENIRLSTEIIKKSPKSNEFYMIYENKGEISIGIGRYLSFSVYKDKIYVTNEDKISEIPVKDISCDLHLAFNKINMNNWRAYGIINFDYAQNTFTEYKNLGKLMELVIPNIDIRLYEDKLSIRYLESFQKDIELIKNIILDGNSIQSDRVERHMDNEIIDRVKFADEDYYKEIVNKAVDEINKGYYEKVILSRKINLDKRFSSLDSYVEGRKHNNPARSYCIRINELEAVGFSPETVAEVDEKGIVYTFPLAGTRALTENEKINDELKDELLKDPKEIAEHAVSVKLAFEELQSICLEDTVSVIQFMDILKRGTVQHLGSRLSGKLKDNLNEWHGVKALFPAVTASGIPKKESIKAIASLEKDKRDLYSGGVLTYDSGGAIDIALVLRTAFQNKQESWVRVGAGIVKLSNPEREFEETKEKVGSIINRLVYEN